MSIGSEVLKDLRRSEKGVPAEAEAGLRRWMLGVRRRSGRLSQKCGVLLFALNILSPGRNERSKHNASAIIFYP